jgi:hypothetical protein
MDERPETFLSLAGRFILLASGVCLPGLLLANAALRGMVAPPFDPEDDTPWVQLAPSVAAWPMLEAVEGATPEQVVDRLGPPIRVHRGGDACDRCAQTYVYAALLDAERIGVGVCITSEGRAFGSCGSGMRFDLRSMSYGNHALGMVLSWPLMVLIALPLALLRGLRLRLRPGRLTTLTSAGVERSCRTSRAAS